MKHSILPPSSAARRVACPGSRALEALYPQEKTEASMEGDAAHWLAAHYLKNPTLLKATNHSSVAPNGVLITEEMIEGAKLYANEICSIEPFNELLIIEKGINIFNIHEKCWGTPDCWYFNNYTNTLYIWDYKFGHRYVDVCENWQLIEYSAGILDFIKKRTEERENGLKHAEAFYSYKVNNIKVIFTIVQPRCYQAEPIRKWQTTSEELERKYFSQLRKTEELAMQDHAPCNPSPECRDCKARFACPALQETALGIGESVTMTNTPFELNSQQLGTQLKYLKKCAELLDARITGLEQQAISRLNSGESIPNFYLERTKGRQVWKVSGLEAIVMGRLFGKDLSKAPEAITPKQAIKAGIPEHVINQYSETTKGSVKLALETFNQSQKIFGEK